MDADQLLLLLKKYLNHVGDIEGTCFLGKSLDESPEFTEEERALLRKLSVEDFGG